MQQYIVALKKKIKYDYYTYMTYILYKYGFIIHVDQ